MTSLRAATRRAVSAASLLFAAGLLVVGPAEASRTTTDARPGLAPSASRELASLGLPILEPLDSAESSPRFGFAEDLALLDVEARSCGFELFGGVGTNRCALTYARNNPLKYVDPDGKLWRLAPGADADALVGALTEYVQHPSGWQAFHEIAESETITVVLGTGSLNEDLDQAEFDLQAGRHPEVKFGDTSPPVAATFRMKLDFDAIRRFGSRTEKGGEQSTAGGTTVGHEIAHVKAGVKGGYLAMKAGDWPRSAKGTAQKEAVKILKEKTTRSKEEAEKSVKTYLLPCTTGTWGCR